MNVFSSTDWNRKTGEIFEAARRGVVTITQRKRPAFVVMSYDRYQRLIKADNRLVLGIDDIPEDMLLDAKSAYEAFKRGEQA